MLNKKGPEIYSGKEEELKSRFEADGYNWEEIKQKLENIEKSEEIESRLQNLEGKTEDYYNYLKGLLDNQLSENKNPQNESLADKTKNRALDAGEKAFLSQAEKLKKIPILGNALYGVAEDLAAKTKESMQPKENEGIFDKFGREIKIGVSIFILGLFGLKNIKETISGVNLSEEQISSVGTTISDSVSNVSDSITNSISDRVSTNIQDENNLPQSQDNLAQSVANDLQSSLQNGSDSSNDSPERILEALKSRYSSSGFMILKSLQIETYITTDTTELFSRIRGKTYRETISDFDFVDNNGSYSESKMDDYISKNPSLKNYQKQDIYNILRLFSIQESTRIFLKRITSDNLRAIPEDELRAVLSESEFNKLKQDDYKFDNLTLESITSLLGLTFKGIASTTLLAGYEAGKNFFHDSLFGAGEFFNEIKDDLTKRKNNLLPEKVLLTLIGDSGINAGGAEKVDIKFEELDSSRLNPEETEKLKRFLNFRNTVLEKFRENNTSKFNLGLGEEFIINFNKVISLKEILYLYLAFDGKTDFLNGEDFVSNGLVIAWLSKIFESNTNTKEFYGKYLEKLRQNTFEKESIFSDDEKKILELFYTKILKKVSTGYIDTVNIIRGGVNEFIKSQLTFIPNSEIKNYIATSIEAGATIGAIYLGIKSKFARFLLIPALPYLGILLITAYSKFKENGVSLKDYEQGKAFINEVLEGNKFETIVKDKNGKQGTILLNSFETLESAYEDIDSVIAEQREKLDVNFKNFNLEIFKSTKGYNFIHNGKKYRIDYAPSNPLSTAKRLNPFDKKFSSYSDIIYGEEGYIGFGIGSNQVNISFKDIENAFIGGEISIPLRFIGAEVLSGYNINEKYVLREEK